MMKKVPKRRFKGFLNAGDWEQRKLGDVVKRESVTQVSSTEYPAIEYEDVIPETGQLNKDIYKKGVQKAGILFDANKVLYGKLRPYLHNWVAPMYKGVAVGDWWVLNPCGLDRGFLYTLIQTVKFDTIANQSTGSKMPRADWKLLSTTEFSIPSLDEQIKIGKLVEGLNDYITLHQRKLEKLQATKKALLYELFPIENSRRPKRRFKGFTDDWEQRKLGEAATVEMNKRIFKEQTSSEGEVPFYKIGTFGGAADSYISRDLYEEYKKKYPYPNSGDILISASGSIGRTVVYNGEEAYFQDSNIVWLNHEGRINNSFLLQFYNVVKWSGLEGSTIKRLYNKNILETPILLPKLEEQQLIGGFLKLVDDNITLHQRKLEKLKNLKAAYLNEMFV